jgi:hypothetical protein
MSTIKSDTADLTLNADGASSSLKLQIDGVEKASVSAAGAFTSTSIDATKLTGALPALDGSSLTGISTGVTTTLTATSNIGLGVGAVDSITTGDYNVGLGDSALTATTTGEQNIALGYSSLSVNTTGSLNTAVGHRTLDNNTASNNTAVGWTALRFNTTGSDNTASGYQALYNNTTASTNTAIGRYTLYSNTVAAGQTAVGHGALKDCTTGPSNTAVGNECQGRNITGQWNVAVGESALITNTAGHGNVGIGRESLKLTTGTNNVGVGYKAGDNITTGGTNIIIGANIDAPSATASNQLNIGNWIYGDGGNIGIGTTSLGVKLNVESSASETYARIKNTSASGQAILVLNNDVGNWQVKCDTDDSFRIRDNGNAKDRLLIDSGGTITTPYDGGRAALGPRVVLGGGNLNGNVGYSHQGIYVATTANASDDWCYVADNGYGKVLNVKFRGTQVGSIGCWNTSTQFNTTSDYRLKENLVPITDSIERVKLLKPYRFNFILEPDVTVDGFVAHEVSESGACPEAITGEKDAMMVEKYMITHAVAEVKEVKDDEGNIVVEAVEAVEGVVGEHEVIDPQSIDQSKLVPVMCSAIQELITMNENLIARIEILENN